MTKLNYDFRKKAGHSIMPISGRKRVKCILFPGKEPVIVTQNTEGEHDFKHLGKIMKA